MPPKPSRPARNPFRIGGIVTGAYFTDRAGELRRIMDVLRKPQGKLLVTGPRRMGKTSTLARAVERLSRDGDAALLADLSTATTTVDLANRVLAAATASLGRRWKDVVAELVGRIQLEVTLNPNRTGGALPSLSLRYRTAPIEEQNATLGQVLDAIDDLAGKRGVTVGVVLDEFQEIARVDGGEAAEWHLRRLYDKIVEIDIFSQIKNQTVILFAV